LIEKQLFENNFISRRATARRLKNAAQEYACREAIRLGERKARTAKLPQGPVRDEKKKVVLVVSNLKTHG